MQRWVLLLIIGLAVLVNLVNAFGPELGFDALWYHLTIPKIYQMWGKVDFIPGGLLYYSAMPRLGEFLYWFGDVPAHLVNWFFGIATAVVIYKISKRYLASSYALLATCIFYVTPIIGFMSGSAYVDIIRTFFECLAFYFVISNQQIKAGVALGLAISTKTFAIGSVPILIVVDILLNKKFRNSILIFILSFLVGGGWFLWSYLKTGYPFYPIGAGILDQTHNLIIRNPLSLISDFWNLWIKPVDVITPVYLLILPFLTFKKIPKELIIYVLLSYLVWWLTPNTGGGRFILPYLPAWAVAVTVIIKNSGQKILVVAVILISVLNIGYRVLAQKKLIPYFSGKQNKVAYLCQNLDFKTRVYVDCDGWLGQNVSESELLYVTGVHNLYYLNRNFVHETWYRGEKIDYVLAQGPGIKFPDSGPWLLVHSDQKTDTGIYRRL